MGTSGNVARGDVLAGLPVARWMMTMAVAASACGGQATPTAPVAPANPTHHAVVEGSVQFGPGWDTDSLVVGTQFDSTAASALRLNVAGGGAASRAGAYQFTVQTSAPQSADGTGRVELLFIRVRRDLSQRVVATRLLTIRVARLDTTPPVTRAPDLTLPE